MRVLLVEDNTAIGDGLKQGLSLGGHTVDWLADGREAERALVADEFDAVVLDLRLPGRSGLEILAEWRSAKRTVPVLALTGRAGIFRCAAALDRGADDYVTKPVRLDELEARLRALQRRSANYAHDLLACGEIRFERTSRTARLGASPIELTTYEAVVLETLLEQPDHAIGYTRLQARLYGWSEGPESNSVQVLIHRLRTKIGRHRIQTIRGFGYRLVP